MFGGVVGHQPVHLTELVGAGEAARVGREIVHGELQHVGVDARPLAIVEFVFETNVVQADLGANPGAGFGVACFRDLGLVLGELPGVEVKLSPSFFKEFVVDFSGTGKSVAEWMVLGESEIDLHASDIARFHEHHKTWDHIRSRTGEGSNIEVSMLEAMEMQNRLLRRIAEALEDRE